MNLSSLKPEIDRLASEGISVWLDLNPNYIRILLKNKDDKTAKKVFDGDGNDLSAAVANLRASLVR